MVIKTVVDTKDAVANVEELKGELNDTKKQAVGTNGKGGAFGSMASLIPGLSPMIGTVTGKLGVLSTAFKTLRGAIIATGIGALIVLIGSVIAAFQRFQEQNDKLAVFMSKVGTVITKITDTLGTLGSVIISVFTEPQKAIDGISNAIEGVWNWMKSLNDLIIGTLYRGILNLKLGFLEAAAAAAEFLGFDETAADLQKSIDETNNKIEQIKKTTSEAADAVAEPFVNAYNAVVDYINVLDEVAEAEGRLKTREIELEKTINKQIESQAKRNKQIAQYRLLAEDETKSYEDRITALQSALDLENQNLQEKLKNAKEEAKIIEERNALTESSRDDLKAEAEARAKVFELEEQSIKMQKRIFTELQTLQKEKETNDQKAIEDERKRREEENQKYLDDQKRLEEVRLALIRDAKEKEIAEANARYDALFEKAMGDAELEKQILEAQQMELQAIEDKFRIEKETKEAESAERIRRTEQELQQAKISLAANSIGVLTNLANAFAAGDEKRAKKVFALTKSLELAQAVVSTYAAANRVLADPTLIGPSRFIAVAGAISTGLANVAKIATTKMGSTGGGGSSGGGGGFGGGSQAPNPASAVDLNFLNQQPPVQAYVLQDDLKSNAEASQRIRDLASL